jgi:short-subunit dehydrogenase
VPGELALVTGASSGIGAEFARQLGAAGLDLVLVARRADRLEQLRAEITTQRRVRCHVIVQDLSRPESPREVFDETERRGLEVDWLINNAGFGTEGAFADLPLDHEIEQIQVNVSTPVGLTHLYLPGMLARKRGRIVNLGSVGSFVSSPYMATYSGTKAFILGFSEALASELSGTGVAVVLVCPGSTKTEFQDVAGNAGKLPEFSFMSAEATVRHSIAAARRGTRICVPGWKNKMAVAITRLAPRRLLVHVAGSFFRPKAGRP